MTGPLRVGFILELPHQLEVVSFQNGAPPEAIILFGIMQTKTISLLGLLLDQMKPLLLLQRLIEKQKQIDGCISW